MAKIENMKLRAAVSTAVKEFQHETGMLVTIVEIEWSTGEHGEPHFILDIDINGEVT